ncbi:hypothetical protein [Actinomadura sp. NEAU-AAG7]|uniref:hypothetical protein n=1 Tax=Actinomadura sp. NEAU-AAG7 TaxID=2839640 RepID=UPI001BE4A9B1|nr:hypothetical protein [Actinomadura sp. NEAU-AAG7]MBT2210807.1 hypothetical protein [Actinomadura sp. NEAU-AAG7]
MTGWDEEAMARLRAAARRGDGAGGLAALGDRPLGPVLQYAGDVLVAALTEGRPAGEQARRVLAELRERDLPGDAELADEVAAALGTPRTGEPLTPLPVDLGALAAALDDDEPHLLDLHRGDVLPAVDLADDPAFDMAGPAYDPDRWLLIQPGQPACDSTEEARRAHARHWLAAQGHRPAPRTL